VLGGDQLRRWVDHFGTSQAQVERDHLISHLLLRLPALLPDATFFGGTALCRTHLPDWRLSEDIDLLVDDPAAARTTLERGLRRAMRRDFPALATHWSIIGGTTNAQIETDGLVVRLQLVVRDAGYRRYPTWPTPVVLRYEDLPPSVVLSCPTMDGAAAMKLVAWTERAAARDLCDLFGFADMRLLAGEALVIARQAAWPVQPHHFDDAHLPSADAWNAALRHQMARVPDREQALDRVRETVATLAGWDIT
jgi:predicted nucleotidyltransferase component of viral defense system